AQGGGRLHHWQRQETRRRCAVGRKGGPVTERTTLDGPCFRSGIPRPVVAVREAVCELTDEEDQMATTRLQQDILTGPSREAVKVNWMPGQRLRLDFSGTGPVVVTKISPDPKSGDTHIEIRYGD